MEPQQITAAAADTIAAVATPAGTGGIAVIRLSGPEAFEILAKVWRGADPVAMKSHTAHFGTIVDEDGHPLDQAVVTVFRAPRSFTGEDVAEISCHGSRWIQRQIIALLIRNGARGAEPGEFTRRAFLNGRLDLAQAEGIADLIAADSRAAHRLAMQQTDGAFSRRLDSLRQQLIDFASMLELELDFSEEEVEFADRSRLRELADITLATIRHLASTYAAGRAFKEGIPVVIAGEPNAGKSTLLNRLLDEDKAIVTDIPGTTRDTIEGIREIGGALFRFVDTAGLRPTDDAVERLGIDRAMSRLRRAAIVIWVVDPTRPVAPQLATIAQAVASAEETHNILLLNKSDLSDDAPLPADIPSVITETIKASASTGEGLDRLIAMLSAYASEKSGAENDIMITNERHHDALLRAAEALTRARRLLDDGTSADFIAQDIREAIAHLSEITGAITAPTLLSTIFSRFCIGK